AKLWVMPTTGEPTVVVQRTWGYTGLQIAGNTLVTAMQWHSQAATEHEHEELATARNEAKASGVLYSQFPTRYWDQDLPPGRTVLGVAPIPEPGDTPAFSRLDLPAGRLVNWHLDPSATYVLLTMSQHHGNTPDDVETQVLYRIELATGATTELLVSTPDRAYSAGPISPDGTRAVIRLHTPRRDGVNLSVYAAILALQTGVFCQILLSHVCTRIEPRERLNMSHVCTLELSGTSSTIELLNVVWSWWLFHGCIGDSVG